MFGCCCQCQGNGTEQSIVVEQMATFSGPDAVQVRGSGQAARDGNVVDLGLVSDRDQDGEVISLTVNGAEAEDLGAMFDTSGVTAIHIAHAPKKDSAFTPRGGKGLQEGDYIMSINGFAGDANRMIHEALGKSKLEVKASRPLTFAISVDKSKHPLGCTINYDLDIGTSLQIEEIGLGAVQAWNEAHSDKLVQVNDRIVAVDSKTGNGTDLLEMIKTGDGAVELLISRPKWAPATA